MGGILAVTMVALGCPRALAVEPAVEEGPLETAPLETGTPETETHGETLARVLASPDGYLFFRDQVKTLVTVVDAETLEPVLETQFPAGLVRPVRGGPRLVVADGFRREETSWPPRYVLQRPVDAATRGAVPLDRGLSPKADCRYDQAYFSDDPRLVLLNIEGELWRARFRWDTGSVERETQITTGRPLLAAAKHQGLFFHRWVGRYAYFKGSARRPFTVVDVATGAVRRVDQPQRVDSTSPRRTKSVTRVAGGISVFDYAASKEYTIAFRYPLRLKDKGKKKVKVGRDHIAWIDERRFLYAMSTNRVLLIDAEERTVTPFTNDTSLPVSTSPERGWRIAGVEMLSDGSAAVIRRYGLISDFDDDAPTYLHALDLKARTVGRGLPITPHYQFVAADACLFENRSEDTAERGLWCLNPQTGKRFRLTPVLQLSRAGRNAIRNHASGRFLIPLSRTGKPWAPFDWLSVDTRTGAKIPINAPAGAVRVERFGPPIDLSYSDRRSPWGARGKATPPPSAGPLQAGVRFGSRTDETDPHAVVSLLMRAEGVEFTERQWLELWTQVRRRDRGRRSLWSASTEQGLLPYGQPAAFYEAADRRAAENPPTTPFLRSGFRGRDTIDGRLTPELKQALRAWLTARGRAIRQVRLYGELGLDIDRRAPELRLGGRPRGRTAGLLSAYSSERLIAIGDPGAAAFGYGNTAGWSPMVAAESGHVLQTMLLSKPRRAIFNSLPSDLLAALKQPGAGPYRVTLDAEIERVVVDDKAFAGGLKSFRNWSLRGAAQRAKEVVVFLKAGRLTVYRYDQRREAVARDRRSRFRPVYTADLSTLPARAPLPRVAPRGADRLPAASLPWLLVRHRGALLDERFDELLQARWEHEQSTSRAGLDTRFPRVFGARDPKPSLARHQDLTADFREWAAMRAAAVSETQVIRFPAFSFNASTAEGLGASGPFPLRRLGGPPSTRMFTNGVGSLQSILSRKYTSQKIDMKLEAERARASGIEPAPAYGRLDFEAIAHNAALGQRFVYLTGLGAGYVLRDAEGDTRTRAADQSLVESGLEIAGRAEPLHTVLALDQEIWPPPGFTAPRGARPAVELKFRVTKLQVARDSPEEPFVAGMQRWLGRETPEATRPDGERDDGGDFAILHVTVDEATLIDAKNGGRKLASLIVRPRRAFREPKPPLTAAELAAATPAGGGRAGSALGQPSTHPGPLTGHAVGFLAARHVPGFAASRPRQLMLDRWRFENSYFRVFAETPARGASAERHAQRLVEIAKNWRQTQINDANRLAERARWLAPRHAVMGTDASNAVGIFFTDPSDDPPSEDELAGLEERFLAWHAKAVALAPRRFRLRTTKFSVAPTPAASLGAEGRWPLILDAARERVTAEVPLTIYATAASLAEAGGAEQEPWLASIPTKDRYKDDLLPDAYQRMRDALPAALRRLRATPPDITLGALGGAWTVCDRDGRSSRRATTRDVARTGIPIVGMADNPPPVIPLLRLRQEMWLPEGAASPRGAIPAVELELEVVGAELLDEQPAHPWRTALHAWRQTGQSFGNNPPKPRDQGYYVLLQAKLLSARVVDKSAGGKALFALELTPHPGVE
ncbi:MAG: hypothetical protein AAF790_02225 [Planctomycetota bacterium]